MQKSDIFKNYILLIEERIGYSFNDKALLMQSFTHSSYSNETNFPSYERLEFLGDGILGMIIAKGLFNEKPEIAEGVMSPLRSKMVSAIPLSRIFDTINLGEYVITSEGSIVDEVKTSDNIKSDIIEAIIAAIYLDGGIEVAEKFIMKFIYDKNIKDEQNAKDYKSLLYEYAAKNDKKEKFIFKSQPLNGGFQVSLYCDGNEVATHWENKKKEGEKLCAKDFLEKTENNI